MKKKCMGDVGLYVILFKSILTFGACSDPGVNPTGCGPLLLRGYFQPIS